MGLGRGFGGRGRFFFAFDFFAGLALATHNGGVTRGELLDTASRVNHLLLAGIIRMAIRANFDALAGNGRRKLDDIAARTVEGLQGIVRMGIGFHGLRLRGRIDVRGVIVIPAGRGFNC